jgi:threonine dehydratase
MPAGANEAKVRAVRAWGATVELSGADMTEAQERAGKVAAGTGAVVVSPGDTPALLAGVGTLYLELFEAHPDLDAVVVPVGSGTGAAAACLVAAEVAPRCRIIAVQSSAAPAAHDSWRSGKCVTRPNQTTVDGLATGRGFDLPQRLLRGPNGGGPNSDGPDGAGLADFWLVTDDEIAAAQRVLAVHAHTLAEGAGAAALAALLARPAEFAGRRVAVVCTGGNASAREIAALATP